MSWSYDPALVEVALNWVRLRVGDTNTSDQQLSDEEINSFIALSGGDRKAAAVAAARAISAKFTRFGEQVEAENFRRLAEEIASEGAPSYL